MALTDRELVKLAQVGQAQGLGLAAAPKTAVQALHTRSHHCVKVGTENAATNVAETVMFTVNRKGLPLSVKYVTNSAVAGNATDYVLITVQKRVAGVDGGIVASWNTHTSAQSSIAALVPVTFVANADQTIAAGDVLTYTCRKVAAGKLLDAPAAFTVDIEEV